jgi:hypothetical protein
MRFTSILSLAAVATAEYYDDDDLAFIRNLQAGNASNATTTAPTTTTTAAPTTTTAAATTTVAPTTTVAATTTTTAAPTLGPAQAVVTRVVNDSEDNSTTAFAMQTEVSLAPPADLVRPSVGASRLRRLNAAKNKAYNMFCSAFSLNSALLQCQALQGASQIPAGNTVDSAGWAANTYLFPSLEHCMPKIDSPVANTDCFDVSANSDGHCINNVQGASQGLTTHKACTKHEQVGATATYKYKTTTEMNIPSVTLDASATAALTTAKTAAATAAAAPAALVALQTYIVAAAVAMSEDPAVAAEVNFTQSFGLDATAIANAKTALAAGVTAAIVAASAPGATGALATAVTAVAATNPSFATAAIVDTTPAAGTTAGAIQMSVFGAIVVAFTALFF